MTYNIKETNALRWITEQRLPYLEQSGAIRQLNQRLLDKSKSKIENPDGINLPDVKKNRTRTYPLKVTVERDILHVNGEVLIAKGTVTNPFANLPETNKQLLFIDGNKKDHLEYAISVYNSNQQTKIVLVKGQPLKLMRTYSIPFYFDQAQVLINKFTIVCLPTKVYRKQSDLIIEEFKIE